MGRDRLLQCGLQQRQTGVDSAAKRHFQRAIVAINQGFGEGFSLISAYGEFRGALKRDASDGYA